MKSLVTSSINQYTKDKEIYFPEKIPTQDSHCPVMHKQGQFSSSSYDSRYPHKRFNCNQLKEVLQDQEQLGKKLPEMPKLWI